MKEGAWTCTTAQRLDVYSPAAAGHSGLPLELMVLPLGCFSPQTGPAGGDPPPRAAVTLPPFSLPAAPAIPLPCLPPSLTPLLLGVFSVVHTDQSLWEFQTGVDHRDDSGSYLPREKCGCITLFILGSITRPSDEADEAFGSHQLGVEQHPC